MRIKILGHYVFAPVLALALLEWLAILMAHYGQIEVTLADMSAGVHRISVALQAGKTVASVTLPAGPTAPLHVFAAAIG